jgi:hypothetical protein
VFNLLAYQNGPQPLGHRGPPEHNLARIETIPWSDISTTGHAILNLQFFTVVACSFVFFFCFATSEWDFHFLQGCEQQTAGGEGRISLEHSLFRLDGGGLWRSREGHVLCGTDTP